MLLISAVLFSFLFGHQLGSNDFSNEKLFSLGGCGQPRPQLRDQPPPCRLLQVPTQFTIPTIQFFEPLQSPFHRPILSQCPDYLQIKSPSKVHCNPNQTTSHVHLRKQLRGNRMSQSFREAKARGASLKRGRTQHPISLTASHPA